MQNYDRPTLQEINDLLRQHTALIVHFSGTPKGSGSEYDYHYPEDLKKVTAGHCQGGLSCSTVMPNDNFSDLKIANATGCVGVILGLNSKNSVIDVNAADCGTYVVNDVRIVPNYRDLSIVDLEQTIDDRPSGNYNEWVINDYQVLGIFAAAPFFISVLRKPIYLPEMPDYLRASEPQLGIVQTCPIAISAEFAELRIFSFVGGQLVNFENGKWEPFEHNDLYPVSGM